MKKFPISLKKEFSVFKKLDTPGKIQDFLNKIRINFEVGKRTCRSPLQVLKNKEAHCMEGALLAAAVLWHNGEPPILLNLRTTDDDYGHVLAIFKRRGRWGALTKTNHAVLRYRDPVYVSIRELAMSYFNEYFLDSGKKTMRSYSAPFGLSKYGSDWLVSKKNLWKLFDGFMASKHFSVLDKKTIRDLRPADKIEIKAGKITEWKKPRG
ncbi:MAG: hypothetical protein AAB572_01395 [Patescibacteria group bacterium]